MTNKMLHANDSILAMILKGLEKGVDVKYHEGQLWVRICRGSIPNSEFFSVIL